MTPEALLRKILPTWRAHAAAIVGDEFFDRFVATQRSKLLGMLQEALDERSRGRGKSTPKISLAKVLPLPSGDQTPLFHATVETKAFKLALKHLRRFPNPRGTAVPHIVTLYVVDDRLHVHLQTQIIDGHFIVAMPAQGSDHGFIQIEAKSLRKLTLLSSAASVTLSTEGGDALSVRHGPTTTGLAILRDGVAERSPLVVLKQAGVDPKILARAFDAVLYAASRDEARINLNGVYLEDAGPKGTLFATTDGHRMVLHTDMVPWVVGESTKNKESHILLSLEDARHLPSLLGNKMSVGAAHLASKGSETLAFSGAGPLLAWTLVISDVHRVFPPYRQVIPKRSTEQCKVSSAALREALASIKPAGTVHATYQDGRLILKKFGEDDQGFSSSVPLQCEPKGEVEFGAHSSYLLEAVSNGPIADAVATFYYEGPTAAANPLKLDASGPEWSTTAIIMPIRVLPARD